MSAGDDFDVNDAFSDDIEKFRDLEGRDGFDLTPPAALELAFASLTALVALGWLVSLLWVPDTINGQTWMGLGALGMVMFGAPAAAIYGLRRGGMDIVKRVIRDMVR